MLQRFGGTKLSGAFGRVTAKHGIKPLQALPDEWYLRLMYWRRQGTLLRLKNPETYAAKIQWLKLHGGLDRYSSYADKYEVRRYVEGAIGARYLIPLIGVWESFDEIPFDTLPEQFVLKATHGMGYNFICRQKSALDLDSLRQQAASWMGENFYRREREPQYRNITPRLIAETYLEDESGGLRDYKWFCCGGEPQIIQVVTDRANENTRSWYDTGWNRLPVRQNGYPSDQEAIARPAALDDMLKLSARLATGFPFVRVDWYYVAGKIYFGELTFTPASGIMTFEPSSFDVELGSLVDLSQFSEKGQLS